MLKKKFIKSIKEKLEVERQSLLLKNRNRMDIDHEGDEIDEVQSGLIVEIFNQLSQRDREKLLQIGDAIKRINEQTYGLCQDCNDEIMDKRLAINPYSITCISCAEQREMENKR